MGVISKLIKLFAEYFIFFVGFLFIFVVGFLYAFISPQGLLFNLIFLLIALLWVFFIVKYFWELLEKGESRRNK